VGLHGGGGSTVGAGCISPKCNTYKCAPCSTKWARFLGQAALLGGVANTRVPSLAKGLKPRNSLGGGADSNDGVFVAVGALWEIHWK